MTSGQRRDTLLDPQGLSCGSRFTVLSLSGAAYELTFLASLAEGWIVRLPDLRLGRFHSDMVDWRSLRQLEGPLQAPLLRGDEVNVLSTTGPVRGEFERFSCAGLHLRQGRSTQVVPREEILSVDLLFLARELVAADRFLVRSRSGILYEGWVCEAPVNDQVLVEFSSGSRCTLRWSRLLPETLRVKVPISEQVEVACASHDLRRPLRYSSTLVE